MDGGRTLTSAVIGANQWLVFILIILFPNHNYYYLFRMEIHVCPTNLVGVWFLLVQWGVVLVDIGKKLRTR